MRRNDLCVPLQGPGDVPLPGHAEGAPWPAGALYRLAVSVARTTAGREDGEAITMTTVRVEAGVVGGPQVARWAATGEGSIKPACGDSLYIAGGTLRSAGITWCEAPGLNYTTPDCRPTALVC